ncbi:cytochrome c3 family protein [Pelobacter propionicus]|uniref:Cytochrome c family protein n=1 Tax=Pelobacter propionicus (strain DSM 2379 / NBRC 103807 / OttBd1) TaxID=338966 RepID=A1APC0_PELPD|nr:cytochrome c3 family protein [Pelobacter propionicus]ABK99190.1 cytochrome c family protein [Pelobacter propionicus DSM 2379]
MIRVAMYAMILLLTATAPAGAAVQVRDVTFQTRDAGTVLFSHSVHMGHKNMANNCRACHYGIYNLKQKSRFTMADMARGKSCGACHNARVSFSLKQCSRCHQTKEIVYQVSATGATHFSHKKHLETSPDCARCHPGLFAAGPNRRATMVDMEKGRSCGACHNGKSAFGLSRCTSCHPVKEITFRSREAGPTIFKHAQHIESHHCSDCHPSLYATKRRGARVTMAEMEKGKSCGACHNAKVSFSLKQCSRCHQVKEIVYRVKATGATHFSHKKHLEISPDCRGCHPRIFVAGANKRATMADMEKGKSCGACHNGTNAFDVKSCTTCHPADDILFKVRETGPTHFPHARHIEAHHCGDCHTRLYPTTRRSKKVSMAEMEKGKSCGACHNGTNASPLTRCATCHPTKELVFEVKESGNVSFSHTFHGEIYKCGECHPALYATTRSTVMVSMQEMEKEKSCGACHEGKNAFSVAGDCEKCHKM